jgi:hypothetical protein
MYPQIPRSTTDEVDARNYTQKYPQTDEMRVGLTCVGASTRRTVEMRPSSHGKEIE